MPYLITAFLIAIATLNSVQLFLQVRDHQLNPAKAPLHSLGDKFKGLETLFKNERIVGYYTDKNIEHPLVIAQIQQAQYLLAPTVLDLTTMQHPFVILDCSSPQAALSKIQELGLQPLKANNFGIILAANPRAGALQ